MFKNVISFGTIFGRLGTFLPRHLSNMTTTSNSRVVWIDMEMTGLNIEKDHILEVACLVTDTNLTILAEGPDLVLHQSDDVLNGMGEWCIKTHQQSGLTEASRKSTITLQDAEDTILSFMSKHVLQNCSPLAGNSVYMDRLFLRKYMPRVDNYLHYRIIDVSSIKELCRMWQPELYKKTPPKHFQHRALLDIKESVEELKYYKNNFFKVNS